MSARTPSRGEVEAWKQLRALRAEGFAFRREHKFGRYWADFVCLRRKLIVEIDGPLHDNPEARAHDVERDAWLNAEGFVVLRFKDAVIPSSEYWLDEVRTKLRERPAYAFRQRPPHPLPGESFQHMSIARNIVRVVIIDEIKRRDRPKDGDCNRCQNQTNDENPVSLAARSRNPGGLF